MACAKKRGGSGGGGGFWKRGSNDRPPDRQAQTRCAPRIPLHCHTAIPPLHAPLPGPGEAAYVTGPPRSSSAGPCAAASSPTTARHQSAASASGTAGAPPTPGPTPTPPAPGRQCAAGPPRAPRSPTRCPRWWRGAPTARLAVCTALRRLGGGGLSRPGEGPLRRGPRRPTPAPA